MSYKSNIERVKSDYKNALLEYEAEYLRCLKQNPKLKQLEMEIFNLKSKEDYNKDILANLIKQKDQLTLSLGLKFPKPNCEICSDTGYKNGKICPCIISKAFNSNDYPHNFEDFNLNVFNDKDKILAKKALSTALHFCEKFPQTSTINLLILGSTGTGKTFLASCIGEKLSKLGFSVIFCSSFSFINKMLSYHTSSVEQKLEHILPVLDCDLLIIDDLGTESMLKNVTAEYFYMVLNERMRLKKHTLFTTNLDNETIMERYGERFMSRLFDKRLSYGFSLASEDLRLKN